MAAKRRVKYLIFAIIILAGIAVINLTRARLSISDQAAETKFISTYVALSKAASLYSEKPDSLSLIRVEIYRKNECDSTWMANYSRELSSNLENASRIWDRIMVAIDTIKNISITDSTAGVF